MNIWVIIAYDEYEENEENTFIKDHTSHCCFAHCVQQHPLWCLDNLFKINDQKIDPAAYA